MFAPLKNFVRVFQTSNVQFAKKTFSTINSTNSNLFTTYKLNENNLRQYSSAKNNINIHFVDRDGDKKTTKAKIGTNLLDVAIDNNIDLEGFGACEGTLSCSTCHLILKQEDYDQLKEPSDEENDMLDLAFGLTDTSRLGCQIIVEEKMDGWTFEVPSEVSDARDV